ncbi:MAG: cytochrome C biogenesis protein [Sphingobacteriaceae bacterium]|nr:cytochrome C biogenesis protein [Sphingobacteriaceae bacterium]
MKNINYIGEHLLIGNIGHAFIVLSLVAALVSVVSYYFYSKEQLTSDWKKIANYSFTIHSISVIGIAATLFFMLFNHYYEYSYVWQHSNNEMPLEYIMSCFWEGQEGSFLLWSFWNVVLGNILRKTIDAKWEAPTMAIFALVQVFLASMLLGIYFGDYKLGSNPFILLRENPQFADMPFVQMENYLEKLDGRGLNPLLMNYWMTIHPPTLFLGFSSTLIPFVYAIAGLWKRDFTTWQKPALTWTFFSIMILGTGILMGGAWAYEALSFGGFWAWDPVENSSLVPWLVMVGAGHVMIINKNKGGSLFMTHLLAIASFLLVLYSTFLTRSGILGKNSVHAFTDLGMQGQLVIYVLTFILICVILLIHDKLIRISYIIVSLLMLFFGITFGHKVALLLGWMLISLVLTIYSYMKFFPKEEEEESLYSREFWMFVGSLVFLLSALVITYFTSIPVMNKLFQGWLYESEKAGIKVADYNMWQTPFAIIALLLVAITQYFKYKKTDPKQFLKHITLSGILAVVFGASAVIPLYFLKDYSSSSTTEKWNLISYALLFISALFAVFCNLGYWMRILKGNVRHAGASIAHIGFALILLGALVSTSKKQTISQNTSQKNVASLGDNFSAKKSLVLTKGDTLPMGNYLVTYTGKERKGIDVFFHMDYFKKDKDGKLVKAFHLSPMVQDNPRMGQASNPDTKHFIGSDIYTHITYADLSDNKEVKADAYKEPTNFVGHMRDTIFADNAIILIDSITTNLTEEQYSQNDSLLVVTAVLKATDINGNIYRAAPKYILKNNMVLPDEFELNELGLKFIFWKINPNEGSIEIQMSEKVNNTKEFVVLEAYMFPFINVLWLGCLVMIIGTIIAIIERRRVNKLKAQ